MTTIFDDLYHLAPIMIPFQKQLVGSLPFICYHLASGAVEIGRVTFLCWQPPNSIVITSLLDIQIYSFVCLFVCLRRLNPLSLVEIVLVITTQIVGKLCLSKMGT